MMGVRNFEDEPYPLCDLCGGSPSAVERFGVGWWFRCGSCGMSTMIPALQESEQKSLSSEPSESCARFNGRVVSRLHQ
jgi:hypothetical protein